MQSYELQTHLGSGAYADAFLARSLVTGASCVIKSVRPDPKHPCDLLAEGRILASFNHPHIIRCHEIIEDSTGTHIIMEHAEGGDLSERIKYHAKYRAHFSESRILAWFSQLASAVHAVHTYGLIHRDIKPANVFFVSNRVKLGDFGVTCNVTKSDGIDGRTTPIGTPMYMPPEVVGGDIYNQSADIWALGCVLFEMMALAPAFVGGSLGSLMRKIRRGSVDEALLPQEYSRDLIDLVRALLQPSPALRPSIAQILSHPLLLPYLPSVPLAVPFTSRSPLPRIESAKPPVLISSLSSASLASTSSSTSSTSCPDVTSLPELKLKRYSVLPKIGE